MARNNVKWQSQEPRQLFGKPAKSSSSNFADAPVAPMKARSILDRGVVHDSLLEFRHNELARTLGVQWKAQDAGAFHLGGGCVYNPDGIMYDTLLLENTVPTELAYFEIKPRYPHDEAMRKCEKLAAMHRHPVVLFYGDVRTPFASLEGTPIGTAPSYAHQRGLFAMLFTPDGRRIDQLVWMYDVLTQRPRLAVRRNSEDMRHADRRIQGALSAAATAVAPTAIA